MRVYNNEWFYPSCCHIYGLWCDVVGVGLVVKCVWMHRNVLNTDLNTWEMGSVLMRLGREFEATSPIQRPLRSFTAQTDHGHPLVLGEQYIRFILPARKICYKTWNKYFMYLLLQSSRDCCFREEPFWWPPDGNHIKTIYLCYCSTRHLNIHTLTHTPTHIHTHQNTAKHKHTWLKCD